MGDISHGLGMDTGWKGRMSPLQVTGCGFCSGFCDTKRGKAGLGREALEQTQNPTLETTR